MMKPFWPAVLSIAAVVAGCDETAPTSPTPQPSGVSLPADNMQSESVFPPAAGMVFTGPQLGTVQEGETVWVEPWTMWIADPCDGTPNRYFINTTHNFFTARPNRDGLVQVTRARGGWIVDLKGSTFEWVAIKMPNFTGGGYDSQAVLEIRK
jgi:hypothetical protein